MKKTQNLKKTVLWITVLALFVSIIPFGVKAAKVTSISDNCAPIAENMNFKTYKNIAISAPLKAVDPDGDLISFTLASQTRKGKVELSLDGSFTYTPGAGEKGTDSFSYIAIDQYGAVSREACVTIDIKAQSGNVNYSDVDGLSCAYAAHHLAEKGIFTGRKVGDSYFFDPDTPVSRGEFLAMCMDTAGMDKLNRITRTGFYDDAEISAWAKPYISSALLAGIIKGYTNSEGEVVFLPDRSITLSEAAVMLSGVLDISDVKSDCNVPQSSVATWAYQSVANLSACSIINSGSAYDGELTVTRSEAAQMLSAALDVIEARNEDTGGFSLLDWVFG